MSEDAEKKKRQFIYELLERDFQRRLDEIYSTKKIKSEDIVAISIRTLNEEVGELIEKVAMKKDISLIKWMIGVGFTVLSVVMALLKMF